MAAIRERSHYLLTGWTFPETLRPFRARLAQGVGKAMTEFIRAFCGAVCARAARWCLVYRTKIRSHPLRTRARRWLTVKLPAFFHQRVFPQRQILMRSNGRVRYVNLSYGVQALILIAAVGLVGWGGYATNALFAKDRVLAEKNQRIAETLVAYRNLLDQYAESQARFAVAAHNLEANHSYLLGIVKPDAVTKVGAEREPMDSAEKAHRAGLEMIYQANQRLKGWMEEIYASQHDLVRSLTEKTRDDLSETKKLIAGLGIDVERALSEGLATELGQGGPFVAWRPDSVPEETFRTDLATLDRNIDRWEGMQQLLRTLPLTTPSDNFYVTSNYGRRVDPVNDRPAMHYGIDLAGAHKSPVLSTAPGVVVFTGWNGKYGKVVEIDHGRGIRTRYGHLHIISVKNGQRVGFREQLGLMGSTGRSTGTHVHYEIRVNGTPYNPINFFKVGSHVFKNWEKS